MNECKVDNVDLLLFIMKPVKPILKQFTVVVFSVRCLLRKGHHCFFHQVVGRDLMLVEP